MQFLKYINLSLNKKNHENIMISIKLLMQFTVIVLNKY